MQDVPYRMRVQVVVVVVASVGAQGEEVRGQRSTPVQYRNIVVLDLDLRIPATSYLPQIQSELPVVRSS